MTKVDGEGRTIVDARDLLQDKAVKDFIRELSALIKETDTKKIEPFDLVPRVIAYVFRLSV